MVHAPEPSYTAKGEKINMSDEQYYDYCKKSGEYAVERLQSLNLDYDNPTESDKKRVEKVMEQARLRAKREVIREYGQESYSTVTPWPS
jgi:hypothetical protein